MPNTSTPNANTTNKHSNFIALLRLYRKYLATNTTYTSLTKNTRNRIKKNCNTPHFSTQSINFANASKTHSSEHPQTIHTVSNNNEPQDYTYVDCSNSEPLSSQFSSPTPLQIASNPFNSSQGPVTNIDRLLSQAHWNHAFNIVNSSPSFENNHLVFKVPHKKTLSSNSPTRDPDQHSQHSLYR